MQPQRLSLLAVTEQMAAHLWVESTRMRIHSSRCAATLWAKQARAATTAGTACEVAGVAQLAQKEVAALQGQLADLDKRNKLAVRRNETQ